MQLCTWLAQYIKQNSTIDLAGARTNPGQAVCTPNSAKASFNFWAQQSHGAASGIRYFAGHHDSWRWHVIGIVNLSLRVGFSSNK